MSERDAKAQQVNLRDEAELLSALCRELVDSEDPTVQSELIEWSAMSEAAALLSEQFGKLAQGEVPVKIAVVGDFSAGKSSFINHLLGDKDLCPEYDHPTTSCVTSFSYGVKECIVSHEADGHQLKLSRAKYRKQVQINGAHTKVQRFSIFLPLPILEGVELLDTPGFNNPSNPNDSEVTAKIMAEADAFFYLVDVQSGTIAKSGLERLQQIRSRASKAPICLVLSKADQKSPAALEKMKAKLQDTYKDLISGPILCWSTMQLDDRDDLNTLDNMAEMFIQMRQFKLFITRKTLALAMRRHRDQRTLVGVHVESRLQDLIEQVQGQATDVKGRFRELSKRVDQLQEHLCTPYKDEVQQAWEASFVVREIKGTGWIFNDAGIFLSKLTLPSTLLKSLFITKLRERLFVLITQNFKGRARDVRDDINRMCKEALAESVQNAKIMLDQNFSLYAKRHFDYDTSAQNELDEVIKPLGPVVAAKLWNEWPNRIADLLSLINDVYVVSVVVDARKRASKFKDILASYQTIVAEPIFK